MRTAKQIKAAADELKRQADALPETDTFGNDNTSARKQMYLWSGLLTSASRMIDYGAEPYLRKSIHMHPTIKSFVYGEESEIDGYLMHDDGRDILQYGL